MESFTELEDHHIVTMRIPILTGPKGSPVWYEK